jgi:uncharacterized protein YrrD
MKKSIKDILDYKITTKDNTDGKIKDILFDEDTWIIRYLEADFGNIFNDRRVLIPRFLLRDAFVTEGHFHVELTQNEIDNCPRPEQHLPVSRQYEQDLHDYYHVDYYWNQPYAMPVDPVQGASYPMQVPRAEHHEAVSEVDSHLRSFNEIKGYTLHASDGKLGNINDLIIDDSNWKIMYAVINSGNWLSWRKKVLLDIGWIETISHDQKEARTVLNTDAIKDSPEYDPRIPIDSQFENTLHSHYEHNLIRSRT